MNDTSNLFYYHEADNKVIKVSDNKILVYFQIKQFDNQDIKHCYGRLKMNSKEQIQEFIKDFKESDEEKYKQVMKDYYAKERYNSELAKHYLNILK